MSVGFETLAGPQQVIQGIEGSLGFGKIGQEYARSGRWG
jgi:hypothetical protein